MKYVNLGEILYQIHKALLPSGNETTIATLDKTTEIDVAKQFVSILRQCEICDVKFVEDPFDNSHVVGTFKANEVSTNLLQQGVDVFEKRFIKGNLFEEYINENYQILTEDEKYGR